MKLQHGIICLMHTLPVSLQHKALHKLQHEGFHVVQTVLALRQHLPCLKLQQNEACDVLLQLANKVNNAVKGKERDPLDIYVQVNTSGEESKFGVEPQDCVSLAEHVHKECDVLRFAGLMTIGQQDYTSKPEDFQVRQWCCALG